MANKIEDMYYEPETLQLWAAYIAVINGEEYYLAICNNCKNIAGLSREFTRSSMLDKKIECCPKPNYDFRLKNVNNPPPQIKEFVKNWREKNGK